MKNNEFINILQRVHDYARGLGLIVKDSTTLNSYFKGDTNGQKIWTSFKLNDEDELFNVLHMIGHCIQWGISEELRNLGSVLHTNPDDILLRRLQEYEWEANCYALYLLHDLGIYNLDKWLSDQYHKDMYYLTHFYKTGEKVKEITETALRYAFIKELYPKEIPKFTPHAILGSRDGIVIDFN